MIKVLRRFLSALQNRKVGGTAYSRRLELLGLEDRITPATITVSSNADSGAGTLRQAIIDANASAGDDIINFSITGTITLNSLSNTVNASLPTIISASTPITGGGTAGTLTITGPGSSSLTISGLDGGNNNRDFNIFNIDGGGNLTISGVTVSGAKFSSGSGGAFNNAGTLTVTNSNLNSNSASLSNAAVGGGGIYNIGTLTVTNSTLSGNTGQIGGAIFSYNGIVNINNSILSSNTAQLGGAIGTTFGNVNINNSTISSNTAFAGGGPNGGGGIYNGIGALSITNSILSNNSATNGSGNGGAITNTGTLIITNSTLSGNSASGGAGSGGAIANVGPAVNITNSTLSGNSAGSNGVGGAIFNFFGNTSFRKVVTITQSTLSGNSAGRSGGGIYNTGDLNISNTIIANSGGADYVAFGAATIGINTNNLVEDGTITNASSTPAGSGDIMGDPMLGLLQNNGGPTFTMALGFGSPAIGTSPGTGTDQRGFSRITSDIGAYAVSNLIKVTTTADTVNPNDNLTSLREAITLANTTPGNDQISFNLTGASTYIITLDGTLGTLPTIISASTVVSTGTAGTLTITGPGSSSLTISGLDGGNTNRNFNIFNIAGGGNLTISGVTVSGAQKTSANGGAFYNSGTLSVTNSTLSGNSAIFGGGIYNSGGTLTVTNSTLSGNFTNSSFGGGGGGIANSGSGIVTVTNSTLSGNTAYIGGGINNSGNLTVTNSTLSGNATSSSNGGGGGISNNTGGTLNVSNSTFSGNFAFRFGGAIYNRGTGILTVTNSTLSGNTATLTGGGIDNIGTLTVTNSTLSSNTAFNGGGIYNRNRSSLTVTVTNSTLSGNTANGSGGGINNIGILNISNTIIANSIRGGDFAGTAPSTNTNNLVEDGNISGSPYSWTVTGDPLLGPLQNNGGLTFTMTLGFGSPAISTTPLGTPNLDQRGFKRSNNDIGSTAYLAPATINDIVISVNPIGQVGLFLSSAGTAITDFHTAFAGNILTITATTAGNITGSGTGIIIDNTAKTISVDLTLLSVFSEIRIEGNSGNDLVTIGAGGVDLSIVTGGGADQSLIITTGAGNDTLNINNAIKAKGTGAVLITSGGTGTDQINLGATVITTGGNITFSNAVFLAANVTLSAGSGAIGITGNIDSTTGQNYNLTISNTGDVTLGGTIGNTQALGTLLITGNDISLGNVGGANAGTTSNLSVQASDGADNGSITLTGTTYKTNGQQFYNSSAIASSNDGTRPIILSGGPTVSLSSGNGFEAYGDWQLGGRVLSVDTTLLSATGGIIDFNNAKPAFQQVFEGLGSLIVNAGTSGNVNINGAIGISNTPLTALTITNAKNAFFSGALFLDALNITDVTDAAMNTGLVQFVGNLTVNNSMTVSAGGSYDVRMIGASNTIGGATTFLNTGSLTLGILGSDQFNFTGGIIATDPSAVNLVGTVRAAGAGIITLGDSDTPLNVKSGSGAVGGASTGTITLGNANLEDNVTLTVGTGIANTINMAAVTGTASPFSSNLILNTTGAVTVAGAVGTDIGTLTIINSGGTTFQSTVDAATTTITNTTGTVVFNGNLTIRTALVTTAQAYNVSITGTTNNIAGATAFLNTGLITLGDDSGDTFAFDGGLTFTGNAASNIGAAITSSGDVINFGTGGVTLTQNTTVDTTTSSSAGAAIIFSSTLNGTSAGAQSLGLTAGAGNITFMGAVGAGVGTRLGAVTVTSGATVLASSTFTAASFTQSAGSLATTFSDIMNLTNQFDFTGTILNINGTGTNIVGTTMEVSNSGLFTTAIGADITTVGTTVGTFIQNGTGANSLGGYISTTDSLISFATGVTLADGVLMSTGAGNILFSSTLDGGFNLGLAAGTGNITFTGAVGAGVGTRLGAVTVTSGATVLASSTFKAASFLQSAGSVETTFTGLVNLTGAFDFTGASLNINGNGANLIGTTMEVTNSGLFTTAIGANLSVGTEFVQNGASLNSIGGNIASTNDGISFLRGVTLTNGVTMITGAGSGDDISFGFGIFDGASSFNLDLNAGTGGAITGTSVAINDLTIINGTSVVFTDPVTVNDLITTSATALAFTTISLTGFTNTFMANVDFLNTGTVTLVTVATHSYLAAA